MKIFITCLVFISASVSLNAQDLNPAWVPKINYDSLGTLLLSEFVQEFNRDTIEISNVLKNQYSFCITLLEINGKTRYGIGFEEDRYFTRPEQSLQDARNTVNFRIKFYNKQQKIISRQKKKSNQLNVSDFTFESSSFGGQFLILNYVSVNSSLIITEILFLVRFESEIETKFYSVTSVNK